MRSFIFGSYMNKQLTLFTHSGNDHIVLTADQLSRLKLPFPFVGTKDEYGSFLGILAVLRPDSVMEHSHAGTSQDVPFGSFPWWIEYTQEY